MSTDVEGSTRLWEESPDAMGAALARHDAIVRGAIERADGYVFADFASVSKAVDAEA